MQTSEEREATLQLYHKNRLNLMPLRDKRPALSEWKQYHESQCLQKVGNHQNVGIILGKTSENVICLDYDDWLKLNNEDIPVDDILNKTLVEKSGDGYHIYLRLDNPTTKFILKKGDKRIEVLGQGQYVVGATSDHYEKGNDGNYQKTGKRYEIISNVTTIMEISKLELCNRFFKKGWTVDQNKTDEISLEVSTPIVELEKGEWTQGERYTKGFSLCVKYFTKGLDEQEIFGNLAVINQTCKPPHDYKELQRIVKDAKEMHRQNQEKKKQEEKHLKEKKKQNTWDSITKQIMEDKDFLTLKGTEKILTFDGKRYSEKEALAFIKSKVDELVPYESAKFTNEVLQKIKVRTYTDIESFDAEPDKLNIDNGILSLKTLKTLPHSPDNLTTTLVPVEYEEPVIPITEETIFQDIEKNLKDTLFWKFITSCHTIDGEIDRVKVETALELFASVFVKKQIDGKASMHLGKGDNGKSVFLSYMQNMLGDENTSSIPMQKLAEDKFACANLLGKMLNQFPDLERNELRYTGTLKAVCTEDRISGEFKRQDSFDFTPKCKLVFSCNRFPKVFDQSEGFFRRWIILKWGRDFNNDPERDVQLLDKLCQDKEEKKKVFSAIIHLSRRLLETGKFTHTQDWKEVQKTWNANADPLEDFVSNHLKEGDNHTTIRDMHEWYKEKTYEMGEEPLGIGKFAKAFEVFYVQSKDNNKRIWLNVEPKRPIQTKFPEGEKE